MLTFKVKTDGDLEGYEEEYETKQDLMDNINWSYSRLLNVWEYGDIIGVRWLDFYTGEEKVTRYHWYTPQVDCSECGYPKAANSDCATCDLRAWSNLP